MTKEEDEGAEGDEVVGQFLERTQIVEDVPGLLEGSHAGCDGCVGDEHEEEDEEACHADRPWEADQGYQAFDLMLRQCFFMNGLV